MASNLTTVDAAVTARIILAGLTANGLARLAPTSRLQGTVKTITEPDGSQSLDGSYCLSGKGNAFEVDPIASKDWVKIRINTIIETYAYNSRSATTRIAIGFMIIYRVVAVAEILYALVSGISPTCWDSIGEVTALAMNSTPTIALRNTCASITELDICKLPVRVLAVYDEQGDRKHLELIFGHRDGETVEDSTIKANKMYNTMPSLISKAKVL